MKIIGKTDDGYVLTATEDEIANLAGWYSSYTRRRDGGGKLGIGDQVNVASMYRHLSDLRSQSKEIASVAAKLRTAADLIDTLPEPITEVSVGPDAEEASS